MSRIDDNETEKTAFMIRVDAIAKTPDMKTVSARVIVDS
jgi:hypothetical protein